MDGWLKWLVAAACVATLAVAGYFFAREYREAKRTAEMAAAQSLRDRCLNVLASLPVGDDDQVLLTNCLWQGIISKEDIDRVRRAD